MTLCPTQHQNTIYPHSELMYRLDLGEHVYDRALPGSVCVVCGATWVDPVAIDSFRRDAALRLARAGYVSKEIFRLQRETIGLSFEEAAGLLDVTPLSVERWEAGHRPLDRRAANFLALLTTLVGSQEPETRALLLNLIRAKQTPQEIVTMRERRRIVVTIEEKIIQPRSVEDFTIDPPEMVRAERLILFSSAPLMDLKVRALNLGRHSVVFNSNNAELSANAFGPDSPTALVPLTDYLFARGGGLLRVFNSTNQEVRVSGLMNCLVEV